MTKAKWQECDVEDVALALSYEALQEVTVEDGALIFERQDGSAFRVRNTDDPSAAYHGGPVLCERRDAASAHAKEAPEAADRIDEVGP